MPNGGSFTPQKTSRSAPRARKQPGLSKDTQAKILSECDSKFAGRRKAGGGYTYFDFTQNRHFDIAGPNPTQQELKRMDQEYLAYLEANRQTAVNPANAEQAIAAINKQIKLVSYQKVAPPKVTVKQPVAANRLRVRKDAVCKNDAYPAAGQKSQRPCRVCGIPCLARMPSGTLMLNGGFRLLSRLSALPRERIRTMPTAYLADRTAFLTNLWRCRGSRFSSRTA